MTIEYAVETVCLLDVAVDRIRDFTRRVEPEMVVLSGHRPQPAHLPEQPLCRSLKAAYILRQEAAGLLGQVRQDGAGLEQADRLAAVSRRGIDDRWHAIVRRDGEEVGLELIAGADVDRVDRVVQPGFLQEHRDLVAVRRGPVIELDHFSLLGFSAKYKAANAVPCRRQGGRLRSRVRRWV